MPRVPLAEKQPLQRLGVNCVARRTASYSGAAMKQAMALAFRDVVAPPGFQTGDWDLPELTARLFLLYPRLSSRRVDLASFHDTGGRALPFLSREWCFDACRDRLSDESRDAQSSLDCFPRFCRLARRYARTWSGNELTRGQQACSIND